MRSQKGEKEKSSLIKGGVIVRSKKNAVWFPAAAEPLTLH